jgi:hypothetical protein
MNWEEKVNDLRLRRDLLGLNNNQISLLTGVDRSSLGRFFNADNEPRLGLYLLISNFLSSYKDANDIEVKDAVIEKKSNPSDIDFSKALMVSKEKFGEEESNVIGIGKLATVVSPKKEVDMDSLRAIGSGIKPFKCGCWIDEKNQLRRPKGSNCSLYKSEHKK